MNIEISRRKHDIASHKVLWDISKLSRTDIDSWRQSFVYHKTKSLLETKRNVELHICKHTTEENKNRKLVWFCCTQKAVKIKRLETRHRQSPKTIMYVNEKKTCKQSI